VFTEEDLRALAADVSSSESSEQTLTSAAEEVEAILAALPDFRFFAAMGVGSASA
jgi:hypothetical protein